MWLVAVLSDLLASVRAGGSRLEPVLAESELEDGGSVTIQADAPLQPFYLLTPDPDHLDTCGRRVLHTMTTAAADTDQPPPGLTVDALLAMTPIVHGRDIVRLAARHLFLSHVKAQSNVRQVFFPGHRPDEKYAAAAADYGWLGLDLERFACLLVCQAICKLQDEYQMYALLDEHKIDAELDAIYSSPHWKKIGFSLYTTLFKELVKDEKTKIPFSAYMEHNRADWARRMSERVRERAWVYANLIQPVVEGKCTDEEYNRDLNILFIKLHLLDPSTVTHTFDYVRKALPDLNLELVTTNYLGEPVSVCQIQEDVGAALRRPTYPSKGPRLGLADREVFYGIEVLEFITSEAKERALWTGKQPDNRRLSHLRDRCLLM